MRFNPKGDDDSRPTIEDYLAETGHQEEYDSYNESTYAWNPNDHDGTKLRVTKSSIGTFLWCPQQYYLQNIKRIPSETRDYHVRGLNVHDAVEYFWQHSSEAMQEALEMIVLGREQQARFALHNVMRFPEEGFEYGEKQQIRQWVDWQLARLIATNGKHWEPAAVEANIHSMRTVEVDDTPIPIHMRGYIDTIFETGEGGFALIELKTGKWNKSKDTNMRKEMAFYQMMLNYSNHHEFLPITHWGWEFPGGGINGGEGPRVVYEKTRATALKSVENNLKKLVKAHINWEFPPDSFLGRNPVGKCDYCDYKEHCVKWTVTDEYLDKLEEEK